MLSTKEAAKVNKMSHLKIKQKSTHAKQILQKKYSGVFCEQKEAS